MHAIQQTRLSLGRFHISAPRASFIRGATQFLVAAAIVAAATVALVANAPTSDADSIANSTADSTADSTAIEEVRPKLDKEWVWKKEPVRFDHMWRVPYQ
jgi:hypothetical protein